MAPMAVPPRGDVLEDEPLEAGATAMAAASWFSSLKSAASVLVSLACSAPSAPSASSASSPSVSCSTASTATSWDVALVLAPTETTLAEPLVPPDAALVTLTEEEVGVLLDEDSSGLVEGCEDALSSRVVEGCEDAPFSKVVEGFEDALSSGVVEGFEDALLFELGDVLLELDLEDPFVPEDACEVEPELDWPADSDPDATPSPVDAPACSSTPALDPSSVFIPSPACSFANRADGRWMLCGNASGSIMSSRPRSQC